MATSLDRQGGRVLVGHAARFDMPTTIHEKGGTFVEALAPGCFEFALQDPQAPSCVLLRDHDQSLILGRKGVNLFAREDSKGLHFRANIPQTSLGDETLELVRRKILEGMSFAFTVVRESWFEPEKGKSPLRIIEAVGQLFDLSICSSPAYPSTSVQVGRGTVRGPTARERALRIQLAQLSGAKPEKRSTKALGPKIAQPSWFRPGVIRRGCQHAWDDRASHREGRGSSFILPRPSQPEMKGAR